MGRKGVGGSVEVSVGVDVAVRAQAVSKAESTLIIIDMWISLPFIGSLFACCHR